MRRALVVLGLILAASLFALAGPPGLEHTRDHFSAISSVCCRRGSGGSCMEANAARV
jgi:hypothetical protein